MMKSENISPLLLKRIDELVLPCHPYLQENDEIYFLGEYTVGALSEHSPTNRLILNYKKGVERKKLADWPYKERAINEVANLFSNAIFSTLDLCERIKHATLVPIPPSKARDSLEYDDRNFRMLKSIIPACDVRELVLQKQSRLPLHASNSPRSHMSLLNNFCLNEEALDPMPNEIWLFDDTLIKGTHFRAIKEFLKEKIPKVPVVGFFIARSIIKKTNPILYTNNLKNREYAKEAP